MSYFKSRNTNINTNENNLTHEKNAFISSASIKPAVYNYQDELFPDLTLSNKSTTSTKENGCNYASAAATVTNIGPVKKVYEIPANKTEYTFNKTTGKTTVAYGKKSNSELERDKQLQLESEPNYIGETILKELSGNWTRYKTEYDKIHGQHAYDVRFHTAPIYPDTDEEYSDQERDYYSN